jgi:hypothetical protein
MDSVTILSIFVLVGRPGAKPQGLAENEGSDREGN